MATQQRTRRLVLDGFGGPEVMRFEPHDTPAPGAGEVLVDVEAVGVNFADTMVRRGEYRRDQPLSFTPGFEAVGRVAAAGAGSAFEPGAKVAVFTEGGGAYAERVVAPAHRVYPVPEDLPSDVVAALFIQGTAAWFAVHRYGRLQAGEWMLVHAAAGGVGGLAVQLGRLAGARVIGTASSEAKLAVVREHGATAAVLADPATLARDVRAVTGGAGCDVVVDGVCGPVFEPSLQVLANGGRYVIVGAASQQPAMLDARRLMPRAQTVTSFVTARIAEQDPVEPGRTLLEVCDMVRDGRLRLRYEVLPLDRAAEAHRRIERREHVGKIVLAVASTAGRDVPLLSTRRYDELAVGDAWGPFEQRLDASDCDRLRREPGIALAGSEAPPGILPVLCLWGLRRALQGIIAGGVLTRQHFRALAPAPRPGSFAVEVRVTEQQRGPRGLLTSFVFPISQDGVLIAIAEWTILAPPEEEEA